MISHAGFNYMSYRRQNGVAVITALLLTTLAVTIVASLFWQQQVQVRSIENQRMQLQKQWILRGALDWAGLILRESYKSNDAYVSLQDAWAVGLAETRLDSYVENGRSDGEASDATIVGKITDAQSLFNLTNLSLRGEPVLITTDAFKKLLTLLRLDPALADATAKSVAKGQIREVSVGDVKQPEAASQLKFAHVEDLLAVPGFTPDIVEKLRGYVIFLPNSTSININTAPAEVLHATIKDLPLDQAQAFVQSRDKVPFIGVEDAKSQLESLGATPGSPPPFDVKSNYFLVDGKVKLNRAGLAVRALIERTTDATTRLPKTTILWIHENQ